MMNTLSLKELRPNLPRVVESIDGKFDRFTITKRGKPIVVMMSIDDYESLVETLEIQGDKELMLQIQKGEQEIREGKTRSWEDIKKSYVSV